MLHLAIFSPGYISKIFTGKKTVDARFSKVRCMPHGAIEKGDLVLMKKSGGPIVGYFVAGKVKSYANLTSKKIDKIAKENKNALSLDKDFLKSKKSAKYATLIDITRPTKFRLPVVVKKKSLHGWVTLGGESQKQIELL